MYLPSNWTIYFVAFLLCLIMCIAITVLTIDIQITTVFLYTVYFKHYDIVFLFEISHHFVEMSF